MAKVLDAAIPHKSDVGGVRVGLTDTDALTGAMAAIRADVAHAMPGHAVSRVLVQRMRAGVGEVLVGFRRDPEVGPIVMLAAGGIFAEITRDSVLRLAPVDLATAHEMIGELRYTQILDGARGRPQGDLAALAEAIVALSRLATTPDIVEAEINPLIVLPKGEGVVAVDALVRVPS